MKLSIIVPVYNVADYLPKCLDSLLSQELSDCEIILVDDGSTDGVSGALCDEYARRAPERIRVIHQQNGGLGAARNTGLAHAHGEYVLFIDSDDYVSDQMLRTLRPYMEQGLDMVIFSFWLDRDGATEAPPPDDLPLGRTVSLAEAPQLLLATPSAWNKLWRRSLFEDEAIRFPARLWYEDMATTAKLLARAKSILAIPDALYFYVLREGSITRNQNMKRNLEIIQAVEGIADWYRAKGLFETYRKEFEALTVRNVLLAASVRVLKMGRTWDGPEQAERLQVLETLREYTDREYPDWTRSPYNRQMTPRHTLVLRLLQGRHYRLVRGIFQLKERLQAGGF